MTRLRVLGCLLRPRCSKGQQHTEHSYNYADHLGKAPYQGLALHLTPPRRRGGVTRAALFCVNQPAPPCPRQGSSEGPGVLQRTRSSSRPTRSCTPAAWPLRRPARRQRELVPRGRRTDLQSRRGAACARFSFRPGAVTRPACGPGRRSATAAARSSGGGRWPGTAGAR